VNNDVGTLCADRFLQNRSDDFVMKKMAIPKQGHNSWYRECQATWQQMLNPGAPLKRLS